MGDLSEFTIQLGHEADLLEHALANDPGPEPVTLGDAFLAGAYVGLLLAHVHPIAARRVRTDIEGDYREDSLFPGMADRIAQGHAALHAGGPQQEVH